MTDKERLVEMFERVGIEVGRLTGPNGNTGLQVFVQPPVVVGNDRFSTSYFFDPDGKLIGAGVWSG